MQKNIKQAGYCEKLFETVNFAFMKIFDFLIKTALFEAFLLFLGDSCQKLRPKSNAWFGQKLSTQISQKKEKYLKNGLFD